MSPFTIATSIDEATTLMADGARVVAGGTDLVVGHRQGKAPLPDRVVAIDRLAALQGIVSNDEPESHDTVAVRIGALVTHAELMADTTIVGAYTALADGAALVGSPATRNAGTIGGNVMNGSPAMDTGSPLVVLGARFELVSARGIRVVEPHELWTGPGTTSAARDELLTACLLPARPSSSGSAYVRLEYRRAMEIAVVGAAASIGLAGDGSLASIRVALTAVAPTILEVTGLDELAGRAVDDDVLAEVATTAAAQAMPISDLRASDAYRRHTVGVMARRAVDAAAARARGEALAVPVNRSVGIGASAPGR